MLSPESMDGLWAPTFSAELRRTGLDPTVAFTGEIDLAGAPEAGRWLSEAAATAAGRLQVDLRGVTFIDSTGLKTLLDANRRARDAHRRLTILCPADGPVRRLLDLAGVAERFDVVECDPPEHAP